MAKPQQMSKIFDVLWPAAAMVGVLAAVYSVWFMGYASGRSAGRVEAAYGYRQAARNGYDEGYEDGRRGERPYTELALER